MHTAAAMTVNDVVHGEGMNDVPLEVHHDNDSVAAARKLMFDINTAQVELSPELLPALPLIPDAHTHVLTYAHMHPEILTHPTVLSTIHNEPPRHP